MGGAKLRILVSGLLDALLCALGIFLRTKDACPAIVGHVARCGLVWCFTNTFNYFRVFRRHAALLVVAIEELCLLLAPCLTTKSIGTLFKLFVKHHTSPTVSLNGCSEPIWDALPAGHDRRCQ